MRAGAQARRAGHGQARAAARAEAAARSAAAATQRHRDRGLLRDPYTIYAKHVLKLQPLDAIDTPPGAADRGTLIHDSIGEFAKTFADKMPDDPVAALREIGERHFQPLADFPEARVLVAALPPHRRVVGALRDPRRRQARAVRCRDRRQHRDPVRQREVQAHGAGRPHRMSQGRPLRHPGLQDRRAAERASRCCTGLSPQLTLEAAILRKGGFKDIPAGATVAELVYVRLRGGAVAGEEKPIKFKEGTPDSMPTARWRSWPAARQVRRSGQRPTTRCCIRCGRRTTAPTTIWRACRSGR